MPFSTTAPFLASRSSETRPTAPRALPVPASANERTTLGSWSAAVISRWRVSSWRVRHASTPNASASAAAAAAANWLHTTRRARPGSARATPGAAGRFAPAAAASSTRARSSGGGSVSVAYGSRSNTWRRRRTSAARSASSWIRCSSAWASSRRSSPRTYSTSRSSETSMGWLMASSHQVLEGALQRHQGAPRAALHRAEGGIQIGGDLRLAQPLEVGHLEHLALRLGQFGQRAAHALGAVRHRHPLEGRRRRGSLRGPLVPGLQQSHRAATTTQPVDGPRPGHRRQEGAHRPTARVIGGGLAHGHEDLLGEVLGLLAGAQYGERQAVNEFCIPIIERSERGRVCRCGPEQLLVRLRRTIGSIVGGPVQTVSPTSGTGNLPAPSLVRLGQCSGCTPS